MADEQRAARLTPCLRLTFEIVFGYGPTTLAPTPSVPGRGRSTALSLITTIRTLQPHPPVTCNVRSRSSTPSEPSHRSRRPRILWNNCASDHDATRCSRFHASLHWHRRQLPSTMALSSKAHFQRLIAQRFGQRVRFGQRMVDLCIAKRVSSDRHAPPIAALS